MSARESSQKSRERVFFICYRHEDSQLEAILLAKTLSKEFGKDRVFIDRDLEPGTKWSPAIQNRIASAYALLVIIGNRWMPSRTDNREDEVCQEIEFAIKNNVEVVPILLAPATMPLESSLPERIRALPEYQAQKLDVVGHYDEDVARLIRYLGEKYNLRRTRKTVPWVLSIAAVVAILVLGTWLIRSWISPPNYPSARAQDLFDSGQYEEALNTVDLWKRKEPENKSAKFFDSRIREMLARLKSFDAGIQTKNYATARAALDRIHELNKADPNTSNRRARLDEVFAPMFQDEFLGTLDAWIFPKTWSLDHGGLIVRGIGLGSLKEKHYDDFTATFNVTFLNNKGAVWIVRAENNPSRYYMFQLTGPGGNPPCSFTGYRFLNDQRETALGPVAIGANLEIKDDQFTIEIQAAGNKIENFISLVSQPSEKPRLLGQLIDPMIPEGTIGFGTKDGEEFIVRAFKIIPAGVPTL
jgi:hypothetical protein